MPAATAALPDRDATERCGALEQGSRQDRFKQRRRRRSAMVALRGGGAATDGPSQKCFAEWPTKASE